MSDTAQRLPEKIRFYNHYQPVLDAGSYELSVAQDVNISGIQRAHDTDDKKFAHARTFHVSPRRFNLEPGDVHAVYPPGNSVGLFGSTTPHVVLRKRALPWERKLQPNGGVVLPWVALLLFHDGEAPEIRTLPLTEVVGGGNTPNSDGLLRPNLTVRAGVDDEAGGQAMVIDVPRAMFEQISPALEDLRFLTHVRETYTGDKELLGLDVDEWFSVVLSNRLPKPGLNTVHLISLEGWIDVLRRAPSATPARRDISAASSLRLVSLANWSFTEKADSPGNFQRLMAGSTSDF